jgi:hypothetical protein
MTHWILHPFQHQQDCIYEPDHAQLIKDMAERYLSKDGHSQKGSPPILPSKLFLLSPIRTTHQAETDSISKVFPRHSSSTVFDPAYRSSSTTTLRLCVTHQQELTGHDDFGPPRLHKGGGGGNQSRKTGRKTAFNEYIVQWCRQG